MSAIQTRAGLWLVATSLWATGAQALQVEEITPQGVVNEVGQVVLRTDVDAQRFGSAEGARPATISCTDPAAAKGTARWNNAREWVFQFDTPVPAGNRCQVQLDKGFKSATGDPLKGQASYQFEVAGPAVVQTWPASWEQVDEQQVFVLKLNGAATPASLLAHVSCRAQDIGERIPVRAVEGQERSQILEALGLTKAAARQPDHYATLACNRRLTAGSSMQLIYGAGVSTASGVANRQDNRLEYEVRQPFSAELRCERERANAGCLPIRPIRLSFTAPVPRAQAEAIRLVLEGDSLKPKLDPGATVSDLEFTGPLKPLAKYQVVLPGDFKDDGGRVLVNAAAFPQTMATGDLPPLAKFAAAPFGVVERFAEGEAGAAVLPLTLRNALTADNGKAVRPAQLRDLSLHKDADIIRWWGLVQRYDSGSVDRKTAKRDLRSPLPKPLEPDDDYVQTRMLSLLEGQAGVQPLALPQADAKDPRAFEVVGIPLKPGFHVLEIESPQLGASLLDERYAGPPSMFVRTSTLVTNLAVHIKLGREGSAIWVTSLDKGLPVADAAVQVSDCRGNIQASGKTDAQGVLRLPDLEKEAPHCNDHAGSGSWFVSARQADGSDLAFAWSDWQRGIEPWRFNLPTSWSSGPDFVAHSVLDRTLVRAGETVSMKHFVRQQTAAGLGLPKSWPQQLVITHVGSGQQYKQPLQWTNTSGGGRNAVSSFAVPPGAKMGAYTLEMRWPEGGADGARVLSSGEFRVEEFRLPVLQGTIAPVEQGALVQPKKLPVSVTLNYLNGGAAGGHTVQVSAMLRERGVHFDRWSGYSFAAPRGADSADDSQAESDDTPATDGGHLLANKLALTLNAQGQGQVELPITEPIKVPQDLLLEASFADPNGEIQTLRSNQTLWPSAVIAGVRTEGWVSISRKMRFQALAVDHNGQPQTGVPLRVQAVLHTTQTTRKRLVGGFYTYDNQRQSKDLGEICSGKSDARGLLLCESSLTEAGEVELVVTAKDGEGRASLAADTVWITGQGELWFGGQDHDRMDLLAEKDHYAPGETARFQVRMPFREATALLTVEREGVLHSQVVQLKGSDPTIELPVQAGWGPNVFVSVLALRGRLYEVPWYSFFTWGYKTPRSWWNAFWNEGKDYVAPTAMVDLSKPAFRLGVAELRIDDLSQQLKVEVKADKSSYQVREKAKVTIKVSLPDGQPAAGAEVAVAVVDQALLELSPNPSWQLWQGLWQRRPWSVETATAQMEVIGRRHYGRKAAAPGGGGGRAPTRELLDTLLLWQPSVRLDAQGQAQIEVPLNDALTSFEVVAVADAGVSRFGTGSAQIRTSQDLQLISGLPPVVREGDQFRAQITVRNTTKEPMQIRLQPQVTDLDLSVQQLELPAGESREVAWEVKVPQALAQSNSGRISWRLEAHDSRSGARDALSVQQLLLPAVPLTVQQATLVQIDGHLEQPVQWPQHALPGKGGLRLSMSQSLADPKTGVPGLRDWWAAYPYSCLEQTVGRAIGMHDLALWQQTMAKLPTYLDSDGLAYYFPPSGQQAASGSDSLTAFLLSAIPEATEIDAGFALPADLRARMESGLQAFVEGRLERRSWSPRKDLEVRKIAAIAALARNGKAQPRLLESLQINPQEWPTHALIDWLVIVQRLPGLPEREQRLAEAQQLLKNRLSYQGSQVVFSTDAQDQWWWLMQSTDVNAARLLLSTLADSGWDAERARLVTGLLARQKNGAWQTTTANTWAGLALSQFSRRFEAEPVNGSTTALLSATTQTVDWDRLHRAESSGRAQLMAPQEAQAQASRLLPGGSAGVDQPLPLGTVFLPWGSAKQAELQIQHRGTGKPWVAVQSLAAVPRTEALNAGYRIRKTVTAVDGSAKSSLLRGDVLRVRLEVDASADMTWVVINDPIPTGATILGSGLGRDSAIASQGERSPEGAWPSFIERGQDSYRAYYDYLAKGPMVVEYTLRLNNAGDFALPPTRVEALYAPEMFGELPNARLKVNQP